MTVGNPFGLWGMWEGAAASGTLNPQASTLVYSDNIVRGMYWSGSVQRKILLEIYGLCDSSGWDYLVLNGTSFSRSSSTRTVFYTNDVTRPSGRVPSSYKGPITQFMWSGISSNPFPQTVGASVTCKFQHDGFVPAIGAISLNQIHREAGGANATTVSINDSDVRGKSWHSVVQGSTPSSGATQDFADFYWPIHMNDTTVLRRCNPTVNSVSSAQTFRAIRASVGGFAFVGGSGNTPITLTSDIYFTIMQNGTDTFIYVQPSTTSTYTKYDGAGDSSNQTNQTTVFKVEGFAATHVSLYSVAYTSVGSNYDGIRETFSAQTNRLPGSGATYINNSATSFYAMTTNTKYGRSCGALRYYGTTATVGFYNSTVLARYDVTLRKQPNNSSCFLDKVISFSIDMNVIDSVEGGG